MSGAINELVEMFYDISILIPDQKYRNIMDKLKEVNSNHNEEVFLVGTIAWSDGETRPLYVSSNRIEKDMLLVSAYERLSREREELWNEIQHLNHIIEGLSAKINQPPPPRPNAEIELEKALLKIDQLTKLNKKSRFNR
jgi:hypothetical protein